MESLIVRTTIPTPATRGTRHAACARAVSSATIVLLMLALAGCRNLFAPSEPQPPATDTGTVVIPTDYATPEGLLTTLAEAVNARGQGNSAGAYIGAFADTLTGPFGYTQVFDPGVVADRLQAGKAIPAWTRTSERSFFTYLFGTRVAPDPDADYSLSWTPEASDEIDLDAGVAVLTRRYSITAVIPGGSVVQIAYGHARIVMRLIESGSRWAITRWDDTTDPVYGPAPTGETAGFRSFSRLRIDSTEQ